MTVHFRTSISLQVPLRHRIVCRESLSDRPVGGLEAEGGAVDRVGERACQEKLTVVSSRAGQLQVSVAVGVRRSANRSTTS